MIKDLEILARKYEAIANHALKLHHENVQLKQYVAHYTKQLELFMEEKIELMQDNSTLNDKLEHLTQGLELLLQTTHWQEDKQHMGLALPKIKTNSKSIENNDALQD